MKKQKTELSAAWDRVGYTIQARAKWLCHFYVVDLRSLSPDDLARVAWEAKAFTLGAFFEESAGEAPPSAAQIRSAWGWTLLVLGHLKNHSEAETGEFKSNFNLRLSADGIIVSQAVHSALSWDDIFRNETTQVLLGLTTLKIPLRFCQFETCQKPFIPSKKQQYCSDSCSQARRTKRFREANREHFNFLRREYYRRQVERRIEGPARIQPYKRRGDR